MSPMINMMKTYISYKSLWEVSGAVNHIEINMLTNEKYKNVHLNFFVMLIEKTISFLIQY